MLYCSVIFTQYLVIHLVWLLVFQPHYCWSTYYAICTQNSKLRYNWVHYNTLSSIICSVYYLPLSQGVIIWLRSALSHKLLYIIRNLHTAKKLANWYCCMHYSAEWIHTLSTSSVDKLFSTVIVNYSDWLHYWVLYCHCNCSIIRIKFLHVNVLNIVNIRWSSLLMS